MQALQRGVINWDLPAVDAEDEQSCKAHISWIEKEKKKRQCNTDLAKGKMDLTLSFRRKLINNGLNSLKDMKEKTHSFLIKIRYLLALCKIVGAIKQILNSVIVLY